MKPLADKVKTVPPKDISTLSEALRTKITSEQALNDYVKRSTVYKMAPDTLKDEAFERERGQLLSINEMTGGYSKWALKCAYEYIQNRAEPKGELIGVIEASDHPIVSEAAIFFTGSMLDVVEQRGNKMKVYGSGYYANIGA